MPTSADKKQDAKSQKAQAKVSRKQDGGGSDPRLAGNQPEATAQRKRQGAAAGGRQAGPPHQLQTMEDGAAGQRQTIQKKENRTGLPDDLKSGVEGLSGYSLDDVNVHYNSPKPTQLNSYAYTQGSDIHVAPGQEKHLPHETWHVVQQKQGRVQPTLSIAGVDINDSPALEREADGMGSKALQRRTELPPGDAEASPGSTVQREEKEGETQEQKDLLELAEDLKEYKSEIPGYSEDQVEQAIQTIMEAVQSEPAAELAKSVDAIKEGFEGASEKGGEKTTKQFSIWRIAGAVTGALLGTVIPLIGTYLGYREGSEGRGGSVLRGVGGAVLGTVPPVSGFLLGRELYRRGAVFDAINALDFAALPAAPGIFQLGNFQYGSNHAGVIGSMYFQGGGNNQRIRLCHSSGPEVGAPHALAGYQAYFPGYAITYGTTWTNSRTAATVATWAANHPPAPAVPTAGNHIIEYSNLAAGRYRTRHKSRGVVNLLGGITQNDIDLIYHGVNLGFNSTQLRLYINTLIDQGHLMAALRQ